jgi:hypothetical protein
VRAAELKKVEEVATKVVKEDVTRRKKLETER